MRERISLVCWAASASGFKLPPMVIFKRMSMPREEIPSGISVKVNKKGWMMDSVIKEWLQECYGT